MDEATLVYHSIEQLEEIENKLRDDADMLLSQADKCRRMINRKKSTNVAYSIQNEIRRSLNMKEISK